MVYVVKKKALARVRQAGAWQNLPIFWNLTHKKISNRQQYAHFRKSQTMKIPPPYSVQYFPYKCYNNR